MTKGQAALEFTLLLGFLFFLFVSFFAVIQSRFGEVIEQKARQAITDETTVLQNELKTASVMEDGFQRLVELPPTINGQEYLVKLEESEFQLHYKELSYEWSFLLPKNVNVPVLPSPGEKYCLLKQNGKLIINIPSKCTIF